MNQEIQEIRTPDKNLLIGIIVNYNGKNYFVVKNRGKEDYIALDSLIDVITQKEI